MKKFEGILICTDLDGTLLRSDKTISDENVRAIEYFKSEGGRFTFITGRMHYFVQKMYDAIKPNAPLGCGNGSGVYDYPIQKYIWTQNLSHSAIELAEYVVEHISDMGVHLTTFEKVYFCGNNEEMEKFRRRTRLPNLSCSFEEMREPLAKLVFCHPDEKMIRYTMELLESHPRADEFEFIQSEKTLCEILPKGISKGSALPKIAEAVGVDMSRVIAVGDYNNDISMLLAASVGISVGNARPEVKAVADRVTVTNEESAIRRIISEIESGELKI